MAMISPSRLWIGPIAFRLIVGCLIPAPTRRHTLPPWRIPPASTRGLAPGHEPRFLASLIPHPTHAPAPGERSARWCPFLARIGIFPTSQCASADSAYVFLGRPNGEERDSDTPRPVARRALRLVPRLPSAYGIRQGLTRLTLRWRARLLHPTLTRPVPAVSSPGGDPPGSSPCPSFIFIGIAFRSIASRRPTVSDRDGNLAAAAAIEDLGAVANDRCSKADRRYPSITEDPLEREHLQVTGEDGSDNRAARLRS